MQSIQRALTIVVVAAGVSTAVMVKARAERGNPPSWDPKAAAGYMDSRAAWWMDWPTAARDHGTFCVSCHTAAPYAIARPALRALLKEQAPSGIETRLVENVGKRVSLWNEVAPFYPDQSRGIPKTSESRGTESILNAVILSARDRSQGRLGDDTRTAFANMWALQMRTQELSGAWAWLNFHYEPWESPGAPYFGAALAAVAVGLAPDHYAATPAIQDNLKLLGAYLQREHDRQPLLNQLMGVWAAARIEGLLTASERQMTIDAAFRAQRDDGGWSLSTLGSWKRLDGTELPASSDGYATGLATLALQQDGVASSDPRVARGLDWLRTHQDAATGRWIASSLNKERDPASDVGRFMSDAATAYAVMALTQR